MEVSSTITTPLELTPRVATKFTIRVVDFQLFECINIAVSIFDSSDKLLDVKVISICGPEYEAWGDDDNYLINLVQTKINEGLFV